MARFDVQPKKKKENNKTKLLLLFSITFVFTLFVIGAMFKNFSPPVDVNISGNEVSEIEDEDDFQEGEVDSRLKWIQFEDNMTVSPVVQEVLPNSKNNNISVNTKKEEPLFKEDLTEKSSVTEPPLPKNIYKNTYNTVKNESVKLQAPPPVPSIDEVKKVTVSQTSPVKTNSSSKVYVGYYQSLEQAKAVRDRIDSSVPGFSPYVKNVNGQYIVQVGSFSDKTKAINFKLELSDKGFPARVQISE